MPLKLIVPKKSETLKCNASIPTGIIFKYEHHIAQIKMETASKSSKSKMPVGALTRVSFKILPLPLA